jgi:regulator of sigma E protease
MLDFIWNLTAFVIALGILVTVHEYGHFWVARKNGVKVERFSVGFGRPIWRKTDKHGTEFVVAMIPLGGYVKMLDERVDKISEQDKDKTFNCKSVYQRIAIIGAGPFANFAFAIFAFYLMFLIGVPSIKPIIGSVTPGSIAEHAKLTPGTEIVGVGEQQTRDWQDVNLALVAAIGHDSLVIKTKSKDSQFIKKQTLDTQNWQFAPEKMSALSSLGLVPFRPKVYNELAAIESGSPAERAGLRLGDRLIAVNDSEMTPDWASFSSIIKQYPNQSVAITLVRDGVTLVVNATPTGKKQGGKLLGYLGVSPKFDPWPAEYQFNMAYGPLQAVGESVARTWNLVTLSFNMIGKLITGDVSVKNLSGPIAIAQGAGNSAGYGFVYFLGFLALISINLGIINLLPLPILDGGHLLYYLIELLTGKPVPEKVQEVGFRFGAVALLGLMGIALFNDLSRL